MFNKLHKLDCALQKVFNFKTLIELCKAYSKLGWAVQEQLEDALSSSDLSELNSNALRMIVQFLRKAEDNEVVDAGDAADQSEEHLAK